MSDLLHIDFREPRSRAVAVISTSRGVLLVMRGPEDRSQRENLVEWFVQAQVTYGITGTGGEPNQRITLPAYPAVQRERYFINDSLPLGLLPSYPRAVAIGLFPANVVSWRFDFSTHDATMPDARADAWVIPIDAPHTQCGFFRLPYGQGCLP